MNIMELGALGEFVGAIAVVITLIYLAVQLRHNAAMTKASIRQERADWMLSHAEVFSNSDYLPQIAMKIESGADPNEEEKRRWLIYQQSWHRNLEAALFQANDELIDGALWDTQRAAVRMIAASGNALFFEWDRRKIAFSSEYVGFIDTIRSQAAASQQG